MKAFILPLPYRPCKVRIDVSVSIVHNGVELGGKVGIGNNTVGG
jgi:hypothetical protein